MTTLDKLNTMQATDKIYGKRTHPVGTYMLLGFVALIVIAAVSFRTPKHIQDCIDRNGGFGYSHQARQAACEQAHK